MTDAELLRDLLGLLQKAGHTGTVAADDEGEPYLDVTDADGDEHAIIVESPEEEGDELDDEEDED